MCECSSNESESGKEPSLRIETIADKSDSQPPFVLVKVQVSEAALNSTLTDSSSSGCNCSEKKSEMAIEENVNRPVNENKESVDTSDSERDLESCTCTDTRDALESEGCSTSENDAAEFEFTLAIVKPEAMTFRCEIQRTIVSEGFGIVQSRFLQLTPEQVSDFYLDNYERENFDKLVAYMSSGPIVAMILSGNNAIERWKRLAGPEDIAKARLYVPDSIRGKYGKTGDAVENVVHGSDTRKSAEREIRFFFPDCIVEPVPTNEDAAVDQLWRELNVILSEGLVKCCEEKPGDPINWLGNWLLRRSARGPESP